MEQPQTDHWPLAQESASLELMRPLLVATGDPTPLPFESVNPNLYHQHPVIVRVAETGTDPIPHGRGSINLDAHSSGSPEGHNMSLGYPSSDHFSHIPLHPAGVYSTVPMESMDSHFASLHTLPPYHSHYNSILEYPPAPFEDPTAYYQSQLYPWPGYAPGVYFPPTPPMGSPAGASAYFQSAQAPPPPQVYYRDDWAPLSGYEVVAPQPAPAPLSATIPFPTPTEVNHAAKTHSVKNEADSDQCTSCGMLSEEVSKRDGNGFFLCDLCSQSMPPLHPLPATKKTRERPKKSHPPPRRDGLVCSNCNTTSTTLWRRSHEGEPVCNACGLYYKLHHIVRPINMKKEGIQTRKRKPKGTGAKSRRKQQRQLEMEEMRKSEIKIKEEEEKKFMREHFQDSNNPDAIEIMHPGFHHSHHGSESSSVSVVSSDSGYVLAQAPDNNQAHFVPPMVPPGADFSSLGFQTAVKSELSLLEIERTKIEISSPPLHFNHPTSVGISVIVGSG